MFTKRSTSVVTRQVGKLAFIVGICLLLVGCFESPPTPPELGLNIDDVQLQQPDPGDSDRRQKVTVIWKYDTPDRLSLQIIRLHSMLFQGDIFTQTRGCTPQDLLINNETAGPCLPLNQVSHTFRFPGPATFHIIAQDNNNKRFEKFVKLTIKGLEVRLSSVSFTNDGYPIVPLQQKGDSKDAPREMVFENAFGIFSIADRQGDDSRIDGLATALLTTLFDSGSVFFFRTTPPTNERSNGTFSFTRGSQFPSLPPEFLFRSPDGIQFQNRRNFADLIVVAMGVGIDGNVEIKKTSIGDIEVVTGNLKPLFPIITQVDIRSSLNNNNQIFCADMHLGNIAQGLNMAAFRDHVSGLVPGTVGDCRAQVIDIPGFGTGSAGAANNVIAGLQLQTRFGEILTPAQVQFNVKWNNVPLFSDDNLGGLFTSQFSQPDGF